MKTSIRATRAENCNAGIRRRALWVAILAFTLAGALAEALTLTGVQSRKIHGAADTFNREIDTAQSISGAVTVESRAIGTGHKIVFQFDGPVTTYGTPLAFDETGAPVGTLMALTAGNDVVVTLTDVPDNKRIRLVLPNVNGAGDAFVSMGFLVGDVNNSRSVSMADVQQLKARSGQGVDVTNFRFDLNASGVISAADIVTAKSSSPRTLLEATLDITPPVVSTFAVTRSTTRRNRVTVDWTMPGDDGTSGNVTSYALVQRVCNVGDACTIANNTEFAAAAPVPNPPAITPGGSPMNLDIDVMLQKTITFALQATDDAGNQSAIVSASVTTSFTDDTLAGPVGETEYGASVRAGNIDGDSLSDIIVGRTQASTSGGLRILYGNGRIPTDVLATQLGLAGTARMGFSVDNAGDLDGDGYDDVIAGAPGIANSACTAGTGPQTGTAYIFFGGPNGLRGGATPTACSAGGTADCYVALTPPATLSVDQVCSYGMSVAGIANVGGPSQTQSMVAVGAGDRTSTSTRIGKTFLYSLTGTRPDVTLNLVSTLIGGAADYHFGAAVCGVGDVNGDGIPDLVVGAHRRGQIPGVAGRAYLFLGGSRFAGSGSSVNVINDGSASNDGVVLVQAVGANSGDSFGNSCGAAGDLNGDGLNDFVITASSGSQRGVTVVKGRANLDAAPPSVIDLVTIAGAFTAPGEIAAGRDLDGDGRPDLVLGDQTAVYVYGGDATVTVKPMPIASFTGLPGVATGYPVTLISNWKNATMTESALPDIGIGRATGPTGLGVLIKY